MSVNTICGLCGIPIRVKARKRPCKFRYCSFEHYHANRRIRFPRTLIERSCSWCDASVQVEPYRAKFNAVFCSLSCRGNYGATEATKVTAHPVGYISKPNPKTGYVKVRTQTGWVSHHRVVMEEKLGRKLLPGENVHHRNGNKVDNRPENLELWVTAQPAGQRPEDLLTFAYEMIARYEGQIHLTTPKIELDELDATSLV